MYTDNRTNALRFSLRDWPAIGKASSKREGSTRTEGSVDQKGGEDDDEDDEDEDAGMGSTNRCIQDEKDEKDEKIDIESSIVLVSDGYQMGAKKEWVM